MYSKCWPRRWRRTCTHRAKLSMTLTHSSLGICLIFPVIAAFSSPIVWGLFSYTLSLRYKSGGFKSGECAAHSTSHLLLTSLSSNRSLSQARETFDVWGVAPSCWNHCWSRSIPLRRPNDATNFLSTATQRSVFTVWGCSFSSSNQNGPMMPCLEMATHAVHVFFSVMASVRHPAVELYPNTHCSCCLHVLTAESESHWQFCATCASVPSTPRSTFGAHFEKNIKTMQTDSGS